MTINIRQLKGTISWCVCVGLLSALVSNASAQTTAFTYQGKLDDNGTPANGLYDFTMTLWDAGANGVQIGPTLNLSNRPVIDGIFTLTLNFGPGVFNGPPRYLEISLKPAGSVVPPTVLSPRQLVLSAPYAIKSLGSISADSMSIDCVSCITSGQIGSVNGTAIVGSIPISAFPPGSGFYIQNTSVQQATSNFNISGIGRASIFDAATQFSIGGNRILSNPGFNNLFAGVTSGLNNTTGDNLSFFGWEAGVANTTGNGNSFFGSLTGISNSTGSENSFFGRGTGFSNTVGSGNSYFGSNAGRSNVGGSNNSFFGLTAGFVAGGNDNSFFGANAGKFSGGSNNSFFGSGSGVSNIASNNSFFGKNACLANTTGASNAFLGSDAGAANTTGSNNSFFGSSSGVNNIASNNSFFGKNAGFANTTGASNAFLGSDAGAANTTGSNNSFFGSSSGVNNTANNNSFFGKSTGFANTTGTSNSFLGADSGAANTTGSNNSFFGRSAGLANTTGSLNAFFGTEAGSTNVAGGGNSFFGWRAGFFNTGNNNSFFGRAAGTNNSTGFNNSFFGWETGFNNSGSNNAFFGVSAGFANQANENSFFGASAGSSNNTGFLNTFVGRSAGSVNTTGYANTFIGGQSGPVNTTGNDNVFVGKGSGELNTDGGANSFMGARAGRSNVSGEFNTLIGYYADVGVDPSQPNLFNATAIGAQAVVARSDSLVLGSVKGVNNATADTNVGIGTTAPGYPLTIRTAGNASGGLKGWVHTDDVISLGSKVGGTGGQPFGGWIGTITNHPLSFFVNNSTTPTMTLETSGFVSLNGVDSGGSLSLCLGSLNHISFCSSSLRYKTDVQSFPGGLDIINRLRPITFKWKEGGMLDVGFGAEEVEKVEPLLTFRNPKGEIEGVKYSQISAVLVNAIKEQQTQIAAQRNQIEDLETIRTENTRLKAQIAAFAARLQQIERRLNLRK